MANTITIYIIKQDSRIYIYMLSIAGQTAGPIGLKFFCGHSWVDGGCYKLILKKIFFLDIIFKIFKKISFAGSAGPFSLLLIIPEMLMASVFQTV